MANWIISGRADYAAKFYVTADNPIEAFEKCDRGEWDEMEIGEMIDWDVCGIPEKNA